MFDRPRNWKWMVPGALVAPCLVWWSMWSEGGAQKAEWAGVALGLAIVLGIAALFNLLLYVYHYSADMWSEVRAVQNETPEVRMFEAAKSMHPEAVKALLLHRRTIWRQKYIPVKDLVDYILDEAPNVHLGFVNFVLDHSNDTSIMSKRMLSDGSKQFDPEETVTDYEQYDSLILLIQQKLMATQAYGNQAPQWIRPWSLALVRHRFGLDEAVMTDPDEMSETVKAVVRAQSKGQEEIKVNGGLKQLPLENETQRVRTVNAPSKESAVRSLTDEELEALENENRRYASMYRDGKLPN